ncbi:UNVERIFIED_CONTAM: hypothetical protein Sradi_0185600 [Sesamum radiatum]|uniref:Transposase n=1 Tax=Sesamum radiatum TaxID=300843 RepID=A0AAW2W374_SESRA
MATEVGAEGVLAFHYSLDGVNDCKNLHQMHNDLDAINLVNFVDENRMVGVFVEKQKLNENLTENESVGEPEHTDNNEREEEHSVEQPSIDNNQSSDDGDEQSVGEDSDFLTDLLIRVSHANAKWLADRYKDKIWTDPKWPVDSMLTIMQKENKLLFNKSQLYRAKKKVEKMGCGTDGEQYAMLWSYAEEIRNSNPGISKGCRPIICLDGCHLKSSVGGILLSAVGIDANNYQLLPGCEHRFCVMHLYKNFKNTHKGMALKDILWRAARATRMADFEKAMNDMRSKCSCL